MCRRHGRLVNSRCDHSTFAAGACGRRHFPSLFCWAFGAGLLVLVANGCIDPGVHASAEDVEEHTLPTVGTRRVSIKTTNGYVQVRPAKEGDDTIKIRAIIRAQARASASPADVQACRQAIEIALPVTGDDEATQEITWAWNEPKQPGWNADVSFEIVMPVDLNVAAETGNGRIDIVGVLGDCDAISKNGAIRVVAASDREHRDSHRQWPHQGVADQRAGAGRQDRYDQRIDQRRDRENRGC
jgi:hypothetical protein